MGKFDKYENGPALPGAGSGVAIRETAAEELTRIEVEAKRIAAGGGPKSAMRIPAVAIALDATGSMYALLQSAKDAIGEIMRRAAAELGRPLEIELFAYRDYDVPQELLLRSGKATDHHQLATWLAEIEALGGGGNDGEAIEAALSSVLKDGGFACVLLAGDEPPNSMASIQAANRRNQQDSMTIARLLGEQRVPVHSFVVGNDRRTVRDFATLSELSGGKSGKLDGTREMIDLAVLAILASIRGIAAARRYAESVQLTENARAFADALLLEGPRS